MSMTVSKIQNVLTPVLKEHGVSRGVLFGSYAQGLQPCHFYAPSRRALPYANMRKAFSLGYTKRRKRSLLD